MHLYNFHSFCNSRTVTKTPFTKPLVTTLLHYLTSKIPKDLFSKKTGHELSVFYPIFRTLCCTTRIFLIRKRLKNLENFQKSYRNYLLKWCIIYHFSQSERIKFAFLSNLLILFQPQSTISPPNFMWVQVWVIAWNLQEFTSFVQKRGRQWFDYTFLTPESVKDKYFFEVIIIGTAPIPSQPGTNRVSIPQEIVDRNIGAFVDIRHEPI